LAKVDECFAVDVLHRQPRVHVVAAGVDECRDVRMRKRGEYAPLARRKAGHARDVRIEQLERDALGEIGALAFGQVDHAHAAGADAAQQAERADARGHRGTRLAEQVVDGTQQRFGDALLGPVEQHLRDAREFGVVAAESLQLARALAGSQGIEPIDQLAYIGPALRREQAQVGSFGHASPPSARRR